MNTALPALPAQSNRPNSQILVPFGVTYYSIISNPNELITIENLVRLLRSVSPKLDCVFNHVEHNTLDQLEEFKEFAEMVNDSNLAQLNDCFDGVKIDEISNGCERVLRRIKRTLPELKKLSEQTADKLQICISMNGEIAFLRNMVDFEESIVDTIFELLRQVDEFEQSAVEQVKTVSESWMPIRALYEKRIKEYDQQMADD